MKHALTKAERDKSVIVSILRRFGPLSRVGIHELTHLRRSTISQLVRELINEGHLVEAGPSNNPLGRKQILLRINEQTRFVVGVDFDAEFVTAAVMDLAPHVRNLVKEPSILTDDTEGLVKQYRTERSDSMAKAKKSESGSTAKQEKQTKPPTKWVL